MLSTSEAYEREYVHEVYEQIASHFSETRYKPWPIVEAFLENLPAGVVGLDIGCGNGKYLQVNQNVFMIGSDRSSNLTKIASQHQPHVAVVADTLTLPHSPDTFDFAISIAVIHHLSTPERRIAAVKAILETLKMDGKALLYVWALEQKNSRRGWDEGHEQDVMVPWVLKSGKKATEAGNTEAGNMKSGKNGAEIGNIKSGKTAVQGIPTFGEEVMLKPGEKVAEAGKGKSRTGRKAVKVGNMKFDETAVEGIPTSGEKVVEAETLKSGKTAIEREKLEPGEKVLEAGSLSPRKGSADAGITKSGTEVVEIRHVESSMIDAEEGILKSGTKAIEAGKGAATSERTLQRYYHLYRKGELESDVLAAGGKVLESGYERDNWWAIVSRSCKEDD